MLTDAESTQSVCENSSVTVSVSETCIVSILAKTDRPFHIQTLSTDELYKKKPSRHNNNVNENETIKKVQLRKFIMHIIMYHSTIYEQIINH